MKKFTLAASVSLLMSTSVFADPLFTISDDAEVRSRASAALEGTRLKERFDGVYQDSEESVNAKRAIYQKVFTETPMEGVELSGVLTSASGEWDTKIAETLGVDSANHQALLRGLSPRVAEFETWHAAQKKRQVASLLLSALTLGGDNDKDAREAIYSAVTSSEFVTPTVESFDGTDFDLATFAFSHTGPLAHISLFLADPQELKLGGENVLSGKKQRRLFGEGNFLAGGVRRVQENDPSDSSVVYAHSDARANADLTMEEALSGSAFKEGSLKTVTDATWGNDYPEAMVTEVHRILQPAGLFVLEHVGGHNESREDAINVSGLVFVGEGDGFVRYVKPATVKELAAQTDEDGVPLSFSPSNYMKAYADLQKAYGKSKGKVRDAALRGHYIKCGRKEGRVVVPSYFNPALYVSLQKDLPGAAEKQKDPDNWAFKHYVKHGVKEGRAIVPEVDTAQYLRNYTDLRNAANRHANPLIFALNHYAKHGVREGRKFTKE